MQPYLIPQFEFESTFLPDQMIDWNFIDTIDPTDLLITKNKKIMDEIRREFVNATRFTLESSERLLRLFQLLQIVIKDISSKKDKYKNACQLKIDENKKLKKKVKILKGTTNINGAQCPVCYSKFKSMKYLDTHIFTHHGGISEYWQVVRTPYYGFLTQTPKIKPFHPDLQYLYGEMRNFIMLEQKESEMKIKNRLKKEIIKIESEIGNIGSTPIKMNNKANDIKILTRTDTKNAFIVDSSDSESGEIVAVSRSSFAQVPKVNSAFVITDSSSLTDNGSGEHIQVEKRPVIPVSMSSISSESRQTENSEFSRDNSNLQSWKPKPTSTIIPTPLMPTIQEESNEELIPFGSVSQEDDLPDFESEDY